MATGGIGGLFKNSTNRRHITGDGLSICKKHNINLVVIPYWDENRINYDYIMNAYYNLGGY